jgi:uncharacterized protein
VVGRGAILPIRDGEVRAEGWMSGAGMRRQSPGADAGRMLLSALGGWVAYGLALSAARALLGATPALVLHLVLAPAMAAAVTVLAFRRPAALGAWAPACLLVAVVATLDALVFARLAHRVEMFASVVETWAPFVLMFMTSWGVGQALRALPPATVPGPAAAFLAQRRIAVAGVSRDPKDFSRMLARDLARRGYEILPVNPAAPELDGVPCHARVRDIVPPPDALLVLTPADRSAEVVREALAVGVRHVWLHRGAGAGSASPAAVAACQARAVTPVLDLCPYMVLPGAGRGHRLHGMARRWAAAAR